MKKMIALTMALLLMMTALPALAAELAFKKCDFYGGQTLAVYQGPGFEYERGANGWAKCSTDETVYAAGKENGWALVMYYTSGGSTRVGYVDLSQFHYNVNELKLKKLNFEYRRAVIEYDCMMTDDPVLQSRDTAYLPAGAYVTYLGSFYKYQSWAYVEVWVDGHPMRGFVPVECVSF